MRAACGVDGDLALARKKREQTTENDQHYFIDEISHVLIVAFVAVFSVSQEIPVQLWILPMDDKCHILKGCGLRI